MTDEQEPASPQGPGGNKPAFDPSAGHQVRPKLRRVRGFPLQAKNAEGEPVQMLGLADAQQISQRMVATLPAVQHVLPMLDGSRDLDAIVTGVGRGLTRGFLEDLVAQLDDAGLLEGPTFDAMHDEVKVQFDESDVLPPGSSAQVAEALVVQEVGQEATAEQKAEMGPAKLRGALDTWIEQALAKAEDPALDALPAVIVAPHIDYPRGWMNYAAIYGRLRTVERPDRIVILGTNHFGFSTGVCGCDKGFETPLGVSPLDRDLLEAIQARLGPEDAAKLLEHRFDHEREHSVELQLPWIQHCLGPTDPEGGHVPVFAALVHDPTVNGGDAYDGQGLGLEPFMDALRAALEDVGGRTLIVSSADLSHVGPAFGDQKPLAGDEPEAEAARQRVSQIDQEMLALVTGNKPDDLLASMAWQQNPTRWCSVGNLVCAMKVAEPEEVRLLNYAGAMDQQGLSLVSHAALAMS